MFRKNAVVHAFLQSVISCNVFQIILLFTADLKINQWGSAILFSVVSVNFHCFPLHPVGASGKLIIVRRAVFNYQRTGIVKQNQQMYAPNAIAYAVHVWHNYKDACES